MRPWQRGSRARSSSVAGQSWSASPRELGGATEGRPAIILVTGEAGVGKTRLVHEAAARAQASGARILEGGCVPVAGEGLPFAPLIEAMRTLPADLGLLDLERLAGGGYSDLARLVPELRQGPVRADSPQSMALHRVDYSSTPSACSSASRSSHPLLLVIEDIHWSDRSTLEFVSFLARNLSGAHVVVIVTYRTDELPPRHPVVSLLAELARRPIVERIELRAFDGGEVRQQVEAILGTSADHALVQRRPCAFPGEPLLHGGAPRRRRFGWSPAADPAGHPDWPPFKRIRINPGTSCAWPPPVVRRSRRRCWRGSWEVRRRTSTRHLTRPSPATSLSFMTLIGQRTHSGMHCSRKPSTRS